MNLSDRELRLEGYQPTGEAGHIPPPPVTDSIVSHPERGKDGLITKEAIRAIERSLNAGLTVELAIRKGQLAVWEVRKAKREY